MHDRSRRRGDDGDSSTSGRGGVAPGKSTRTQHIQLKPSGRGAPLPDGARGRFEQSLGTDLSSVRVHTGGESAEAAAGLGARAFATGQDIHFGAGQYQPDDPFGMHLLAHEVAHTVQQGSASASPQTKLEVSTPGDTYELEADRAAEAMVRGAPASVSSVGGDVGVQRFDMGGGSLSAGIPGLIGSHESMHDDDAEYDDEGGGGFSLDGGYLDGDADGETEGDGYPPPPVPGAKGADIVKLQKVLGVPPTGVYDEATVGAIYQFQMSHGMERSMHISPQVWAHLYPRTQMVGGGGGSGSGGSGGWGGKKPAGFGGKKKPAASTKKKKKKGGFGG